MSTEQGILAESIFITECIKRNIEIYQPVVDKFGADFLIFSNNQYIKVQVKSCSYADRRYPTSPSYKFNVRRGKASRDRYQKGDYDLLACYIIPLDIFYLIPQSEITATTIRLKPDSTRSRYRLYKNNFNLIGG